MKAQKQRSLISRISAVALLLPLLAIGNTALLAPHLCGCADLHDVICNEQTSSRCTPYPDTAPCGCEESGACPCDFTQDHHQPAVPFVANESKNVVAALNLSFGLPASLRFQQSDNFQQLAAPTPPIPPIARHITVTVLRI